MDLVHHCLASGRRVQRSVLEVVLKIALEAEYSTRAPVPQVRCRTSNCVCCVRMGLFMRATDVSA
jgi:hypothetical protein